MTARKSLDTGKDSFPLYSPCEGTPNLATTEQNEQHPQGLPGGGGEARTGNDKEQTTDSEKDDANKTRRRKGRS